MSAYAGDERAHGRPVSPRRAGVLRPLAIDQVALAPGGFWGALQRRNAETTIPHAERWIERVGTVENFLPPAERSVPQRRGVLFTDSDAYKVLEAMAWEGGRARDPGLERRTARLTAIVERAVEDDGYVNTYWGAYEARDRYSDLQMGHELYCHGHLIQAAVAAARTGGPQSLVRAGVAAADHVCREFGPGGPREAICGHPEIELALVELYRVRGDERCLQTAAAMIERRGRGLLGEGPFGRAYYQDDLPVREAAVMRGHAVRALYLLAGAADVAAESGDTELLAAVERQWHATIARRTYITGGMGSRHEDESFGEDFELPPDRAYAETCAGVAAVMLAWRLLLATGDSRYADHIERTLHNVVLACPSRAGSAFFYTNPLQRRAPGTPPPPDSESRHAATGMRAPWFSVPCCPPNVARLLATLGGYAATVDDDGVQLHLYAAGRVSTDAATLALRTRYPWDGTVDVEIEATQAPPWTLSLRVPSWAGGATVTVGGRSRPAAPGVVRVRRAWRRGDVVRLELPVRPRWSVPAARIDAVRGCVAAERGPLVYCAESLATRDDAALDALVVDPVEAADERPVDGLEDAVGIAVRAREHRAGVACGWPYGGGDRGSAPPGAERRLTLVPYYLWANRGPSTMRVWLPAGRGR